MNEKYVIHLCGGTHSGEEYVMDSIKSNILRFFKMPVPLGFPLSDEVLIPETEDYRIHRILFPSREPYSSIVYFGICEDSSATMCNIINDMWNLYRDQQRNSLK